MPIFLKLVFLKGQGLPSALVGDEICTTSEKMLDNGYLFCSTYFHACALILSQQYVLLLKEDMRCLNVEGVVREKTWNCIILFRGL